MQYQFGTLVEIDLGPAPAGTPIDVNFSYEFEGQTFRHCYVEHEVMHESFSLLTVIGCAVAISIFGISLVIAVIHAVLQYPL